MSQEKCMVCEETVNPDEELFVDGVWYHGTCFKCSQCEEYLLENQYSSFDGILYCKPHYEQKVQKNRRLPRGISLPKPSELRKTSSRLSSIFFNTQDKRRALKLPPSVKIAVPQTISEGNDDGFYDLDALTTSNQVILPAGGQSDPDKIMNLLMQNPGLNSLLAGVSNETEIESQDFLKNMLEQITQNPEMMNSINQLGQQMDENHDLGSLFAAMNGSHDGGDLDMSFMFQQMMPLFSQALNFPGGSSSSLLERNPPSKHVVHRRCFSDSASLNDLSTECQMNLKEAAQKIEEEYPALEIFSSVVESAALSNDHVYDVYGLADLCLEEELAEEFMEMLKRDVCRRLGKRYDGCNMLS